MDVLVIVNFEKFNPRKDRAKHAWVRVDNTIAFSEDLDGLEPDQKWFWVFLLSSASRKQTGSIDLNLPYFEKHSGVKTSKMKAAIQHFQKRGMIQVVPQSVTSGYHSETNGITTDVTDVTNITDVTYTTANCEVLGPAEILMHHWNSLSDVHGNSLGLPKVEKLSDERKGKIRQRLKKIPVGDFTRAMDQIKNFPFLLGAGDKGWLVDFDWMIANDTNYLKILEGKYRNVGLKVVSQTQRNFDHTAEQARRVAAGEL